MTHPNLTVLLGPPGCGKTTSLLDVMEAELKAGVRPDRLAFVSFTKKAAEEARTRAMERFKCGAEDLAYFRTLHSLAFRQLGMRPSMVMQREHYRTLGDKLGLELTLTGPQDDTMYGMQTGDRIMYLETLARVKRQALRSVWEDADEVDIQYQELDRYSRALTAYKDTNGLSDYTDMLEQFVSKASVCVPVLDALIVDEGQDLSELQWLMVAAIAAKAQRVYIAGDDDQAIYRWAGADVAAFQALRGQVRVLDQSYRIPSLVHGLANKILSRMARRTAKVFKPRPERGAIHWYAGAEDVDMGSGTWLLLARNGYMLEGLEDTCKRQGLSYTSVSRNNPLDGPALKAIITYERLRKGLGMPKDAVLNALKLTTQGAVVKVRAGLRAAPADQPVTMAHLQGWGFPANPPIWIKMLDRIQPDDREFFIAARKRGETLTGTPRIKISTIHTAKGGEADNVLLLTDMSQRTFQEAERKPDDEARCWYVAVTRARGGLHLIQPKTQYGFDL